MLFIAALQPTRRSKPATSKRAALPPTEVCLPVRIRLTPTLRICSLGSLEHLLSNLVRAALISVSPDKLQFYKRRWHANAHLLGCVLRRNWLVRVFTHPNAFVRFHRKPNSIVDHALLIVLHSPSTDPSQQACNTDACVGPTNVRSASTAVDVVNSRLKTLVVAIRDCGFFAIFCD